MNAKLKVSSCMAIIVLTVVTIVSTLALLVGAIWIVVTVLRAMNVL